MSYGIDGVCVLVSGPFANLSEDLNLIVDPRTLIL